MIEAKRKDGTPVQVGDWVLAIADNGKKSTGTITNIRGPMTFTSMNYARLQTYDIRSKDGTTCPAHAWHIKAVRPSKQRHRRNK